RNENQLPFLCFALEKMVENVNYDLYTKNLAAKKKMSVKEINDYNDKEKNIPILTGPIRHGLFLTFQEFKNNKPSVLSFTKRKINKKRIYEIVNEKGEVITSYFAFYDGEKLAIGKPLSGLFSSKISQDYYSVYRIGSTFVFFENHVLNDRYEVGVSDT